MKNSFYQLFLMNASLLIFSSLSFSQTTFTFGIELMRAGRELENGIAGKFDRLQFSAKYNFNFSGTVDN